MKVLITGGSGLVGSEITRQLLAEGYEVAFLSRKKDLSSEVKSYFWDINNKFIDPEALNNIHSIIHLAGAGLFDKPWDSAYKKEITESRVNSAQLLLAEIKKHKINLTSFISASGISVYGRDTKDTILTEDSPTSDDFLAEVVKKWESAADDFQDAGIRTVKIRIGIVFSEKEGALSKMILPIRYGVGASLGTGNQYISWIHIKDLASIFVKSIKDQSMKGVFNGTAPHPVTNNEFTKMAARILNRPLVLPAVPSFAIKLFLGKEKSYLALGGNRVNSTKIEKHGYEFKYRDLQSALENLL